MEQKSPADPSDENTENHAAAGPDAADDAAASGAPETAGTASDTAAAGVPSPATPAPTETDPAQRGKPEDRVLRYLRAHIIPSHPDEMAPVIGLRLNPLKRLLGKMVQQGTLRRAGGGRFTTSRFRRNA